MRHTKARWLECPQNSRLAVHGVSTFQCGSRRLAAQHISFDRSHEFVGRVGLTSLELLDGYGPRNSATFSFNHLVRRSTSKRCDSRTTDVPLKSPSVVIRSTASTRSA